MKKLLALFLLTYSLQAATLYSTVTGNFTAAGTWQVASAVANALLDSEAGSTACTTSYVYSATFTLAATNVTGVAVKLAARVASPVGTVSITLANNTSPGTREGTTTINVTDMPASGNGWQMFQFGSAVAPNGTDVYKVGFTCSTTVEATLFRDGTAGNWSRGVMLVTTAAPSANDLLHIPGLLTGAGASTPVTVTMDQTAATSFGTTTPPQGFTTDNKGALTWGTAATTAYTLAHAGIFQCNGGSTLNMGTSVTRMPSGSSGVWTATVASNVDSGWIFANGCTMNAYGVVKTSLQTNLTANVAAAGTTLTVGSTTGWAASDVLAVGSTTRTPGDAENKTILTVDSGTGVTMTAGMTNAHSGTTPTQAFVGNITRNVKFTGTSTTLQGYMLIGNTATVNMDYVEMLDMGSGTTNKRGLDITTTTGSSSITNSSFHDFTVSTSFIVVSGTTHNNWTFSNNIVYNFPNSGGVLVNVTSGTAWTMSGNLFMKMTTTIGVELDNYEGVFTNNVVSSCTQQGMSLNEPSTTVIVGTISGLTVQSNGSWGIQISNTTASTGLITIGTITAWRNAQAAILSTTFLPGLTINTATMFGNVTNNILFNAGVANVTLNNFTSSGDTTFSTTNGISFTNGAMGLKINNGDFSTVTGIKTAHLTADLVFSTANWNYSVWANNTKLGVFTVANSALTTNAANGSFVAFSDYGQTVGDNRVFYPVSGSAITDTTAGLFRTASPSVRLTPLSLARKLTTGNIYIPIAAGTATATLSAYVRKSVGGDGAAYNGATPRLMILANPSVAAAYNSDVVCASGGGAGSFSQLTCTLPTATNAGTLIGYVDVDGTAGWVNVSDIVVATTATGLGNPTYFDRGFMSVTSGTGGTAAGASGGSYTFVQ